MATKIRVHADFGSVAWYFFLTILDIFDDESVNSRFRNKKMAEPKWATKNYI